MNLKKRFKKKNKIKINKTFKRKKLFNMKKFLKIKKLLKKQKLLKKKKFLKILKLKIITFQIYQKINLYSKLIKNNSQFSQIKSNKMNCQNKVYFNNLRIIGKNIKTNGSF